MNIVLIGMRGSGKTTVGKKLAGKLNRKYVEFDRLIGQKAGLSIAEIVKRHGWEYFRDLESAVTKDVATLTNAVIATGGGVVTRGQNISELKSNGAIFYLKASLPTLLQRVGNDYNKRPFLTKAVSIKEDLENVLSQREPLYKASADEIIETDGMSVQNVAEIIIERFKKYEHK